MLKAAEVKRKDVLSQNIFAVTKGLESAITTEHYSRYDGLLQRLDPRVKLATFAVLTAAVSFTGHLAALAAMLLLIPLPAVLSGIRPGFFFKRILLFIPVFTAVIAIPALFITKGDPLLSVGGHTIVTVQGAKTAAFLVLRVTDSLSLGALLVLTTPWTKLLATFRWFRIPSLFVSILSMTYRYIFVLLHTVNNMFLARKSRTPGTLTAKENRKWLGHTLAATMVKSLHISEQVYSAMLSRGYRDDRLTITRFKLHHRDLLWLLFASTVLTLSVWTG